MLVVLVNLNSTNRWPPLSRTNKNTLGSNGQRVKVDEMLEETNYFWCEADFWKIEGQQQDTSEQMVNCSVFLCNLFKK